MQKRAKRRPAREISSYAAVKWRRTLFSAKSGWSPLVIAMDAQARTGAIMSDWV
jgi:hypothetical protein